MNLLNKRLNLTDNCWFDQRYPTEDSLNVKLNYIETEEAWGRYATEVCINEEEAMDIIAFLKEAFNLK